MSNETRVRVLKEAERLCFVPQERGPRAGQRRRNIALLIEELPVEPQRDAFVSAIVRGISQGGDISDAYICKMLKTGMPVVLADNFLYSYPCHSVTFDNLSGGFAATSYLISQGHKRIGTIRGASKYKPLLERYLGYIAALEHNGLPVILELTPPRVAGGEQKGYLEMVNLLALANRPTAVFATSDKVAVNALQAVIDRGLRVPEDISIVGFDDIPAAQVQHPALATVRTSKEELGRLAADKLFNAIDYPGYPYNRSMLPTTLVIRESCSALVH